MRQTDRRTAEKRSKYCPGSKRSLKNAATSSIVMSEQTTINSISMNLGPVQSITAPVRTRTSLPSGAPAEHLTLGQMLVERRKIEDEKLRKEEEQQKRLAEKGQRGQGNLFRR